MSAKATVLRGLAAVIAGFVTWWAVATLIGVPLRIFWPGYAEADAAMDFTLHMLLARLAIGAVATIASGLIAGTIGHNIRSVIGWWLGGILLAFFVPVHIALYAAFPLWYHLTFLVYLVPLAVVSTSGRFGMQPAMD
jgi:hypothetical protein